MKHSTVSSLILKYNETGKTNYMSCFNFYEAKIFKFSFITDKIF